MLTNTESPRLGRYFWIVCSCAWMALLSVVTYVQYNSALGTEYELSWGRTWILLSPWYLNWIWVTAAAFILTRTLDKEDIKPIRQVIGHLIGGALLLLSYFIASTFIRGLLVSRSWDDNIASLLATLSGSAHVDLLIYGCILCIAFSTRLYQRKVNATMEIGRLQVELVEEQLKSLRTQLNPHFLFNALNTISSLVRLQHQQEAVMALSSLSVMLRSILGHKGDKNIKVKDEIVFIESYLALQKLRFEDKLDISIQVSEDCMDLKIPNMLLHPLVENAVQHGAQSETKKNPLQLRITQLKGMLQISLLNAVCEQDTHQGYGIGISTTKERLTKMFDNFNLEQRTLENGMFETQLAIPTGEMDV